MYLLASKFRFLVSFTIEPGRSLLQFVTTNYLKTINQQIYKYSYVQKSEIKVISNSVAEKGYRVIL